MTSPDGSRIVPRPALFDVLAHAGRVTYVSAPPGSGKTLLLRSWIREAGLIGRSAWVAVTHPERDPEGFWPSVLDALRQTPVAASLVRGPLSAPGQDGWMTVERLLEDLGALNDRVWLVVDDAHDLSDEALRQLELLLQRSPAELRFMLATRRDPALRLHRLRLEGEVTEIRAEDLRFTQPEARALFRAAELNLSDSALVRLHRQTEGWAAGLRMAALSLTGHPDPERFAAEFSGSNRAVGDYLLAEVLDRQPAKVRRLLLVTSVLDRVSGPLADHLTGGDGGQRTLNELEETNAFVVSLDAGRSWFRYHRLVLELLRRELSQAAPDEVPGLHHAAAEWFALNGYPAEAVRHAQATEGWGVAARLLCDCWLGLVFDGQIATAHELLAGFPAAAVNGDAELAALAAADELTLGSRDTAERYLGQATDNSAAVPADRRRRFDLNLAVTRLHLARQRGDLPTVAAEAQRLITSAEAPDIGRLGIGTDLRAEALISLGTAELWCQQLANAERHLEQAIALAHRIGRPYLEIRGLAHWAAVASFRGSRLAQERSMRAIELAGRHGWNEEPVAAVAYAARATQLLWQGRLGEAERWLKHGDCVLRDGLEPATGLLLEMDRGLLQIALGRHREALNALRAAQGMADQLVPAHPIATTVGALLVHTLVRLGETERAGTVLAETPARARESGDMRVAAAAVRLARDDPAVASGVLQPVLKDPAPEQQLLTVIAAFLLEAKARDALGDADASQRALERALDYAQPDALLWPFLLHPMPSLLVRRRQRHATQRTLISEVMKALTGQQAAPGPGRMEPPYERLSKAETRVLHYLPTNLAVREIADELYLSTNTVRTHMRHLYTKLGVHRRSAAVERAHALGLLAPASGRQ